MNKSGIAELRRLLRTRDDDKLRRKFLSPRGTSFETFCECHDWTQFTEVEVLAGLTPSELRMFLTFVLYAVDTPQA